MKISKSSKKTASGIVYTGECLFNAFFIGTNGVNDPTITIYDGTDNTGDEIIPTNVYDASLLGLNSAVLKCPVKCWTGIYVEIDCAGAVEVVVHYLERQNWGSA